MTINSSRTALQFDGQPSRSRFTLIRDPRPYESDRPNAFWDDASIGDSAGNIRSLPSPAPEGGFSQQKNARACPWSVL